MIGKASNGIFYVKGNYNVYLIIDNEKSILIDSSNGEDYNLIIEGIEEILSNYDKQIKYMILTSHFEESSGGASYLISFFRIPFVISSSEEAVLIRKGKGNRKNYTPINVNFEVKNNIMKLEDLTLIKSNSPSLGSLLVIYKDFLFSGVNRVSGITGKANYICDIDECKKVEELWYLKKDASHAEDLQKSDIVK